VVTVSLIIANPISKVNCLAERILHRKPELTFFFCCAIMLIKATAFDSGRKTNCEESAQANV